MHQKIRNAPCMNDRLTQEELTVENADIPPGENFVLFRRQRTFPPTISYQVSRVIHVPDRNKELSGAFLYPAVVGTTYMGEEDGAFCSSIQYTVYSTWYTVYSTQYTVYSIQYTVYSTQYTVHSIQHTVYSTQYTAHSIQYTVHSIQ